jgi:hypothetical protein
MVIIISYQDKTCDQCESLLKCSVHFESYSDVLVVNCNRIDIDNGTKQKRKVDISYLIVSSRDF